MGTTLQHGIFLPAEGERNCYAGLASNWTILDGVVGGYGAHAANLTIHVTAADKEAWNGKADASALTAHTGNTTIHVTAADKNTWDAVTGKADASALTAHTGDTTIHVTAADKEAWNGKADDADVVHKSRAETIAGPKTFNSNTSIYNSDNSAITPSLYLRSSKIEIAAQGNTSGDQNLAYADKNNTVYAYVKGGIQSNGSAVKIRAFCKDNSDNSIINEIQILANTNGRKIIFPSYTNEAELGTSSYKWKDVNTVLINGINPGALFLPKDRTARVDISAYFTNTANGATNRVTPPEDGYIYLSITDVVTVHCFSQNASNLTHFGQTFSRPAAGQVNCLFPVRKSDNVAVQWYTTAAAVTVSNAYFIPCKGNV